MNQTEIAYQNKDITSKYLAENFKGKTFSVYGLALPEVRQVLPTNIPAVKANELRLDKVIDRETAGKIRRAIEMTQVAQIFEEEKQQTIQDIATRMIEQGYTTEEILAVITGYSQNDR